MLKKISFKRKKAIPLPDNRKFLTYINRGRRIDKVRSQKSEVRKKIPRKFEILQIIKKALKNLPEVKRSSVARKGLRGKIKYLVFLIEPHWSIIKNGVKSVSNWSIQTAQVVWHSKRGKLILIQTGTITVLASLLFWQIKPSMPQATPTLAQDENTGNYYKIDSLGIRQFLPTAEDYVSPKPFMPLGTLPNQVLLSAWIAPWNLDDQKSNLTKYQTISAFWMSIAEDGSKVVEKSNIDPYLAATSLAEFDKIAQYLSVSGNPNYVLKALTNQEVQNKLIDSMVSSVTKWDFDGIDIDFEALGQENQDIFNIFIKNLSEKFHKANKKVSVTLEAGLNEPPMDWSALSKFADRLVIMLYDYHSRNTGYPGPVASLGWTEVQMQYASEQISKDKLVIALPNYGYDWEKSKDPNAKYQYEGTGISFEKALKIADEKGSQIYRAKGNDQRGFEYGNIPNFTYQDKEGDEHSVWFEDAQSISAKIALVAKYQPKEISFWHAGLGDTQLWEALMQKEQSELIKQEEEAKKVLESLQQ